MFAGGGNCCACLDTFTHTVWISNWPYTGSYRAVFVLLGLVFSSDYISNYWWLEQWVTLPEAPMLRGREGVVMGLPQWILLSLVAGSLIGLYRKKKAALPWNKYDVNLSARYDQIHQRCSISLPSVLYHFKIVWNSISLFPQKNWGYD